MSQSVEGLNLVVVNIEASEHLPEVTGFLINEKPDVVLMQEVFYIDLDKLSQILGMHSRFVPMCRKPYNPRLNPDAGWQNWGR